MTDRSNTPQRLATGGSSRGGSIFRAVALAGVPLSLSSPGATIGVVIVALYGIYRLVRKDPFDEDIKRAGKAMLFCYAVVLLADILNGGGLKNIETAFNYLPLLALAPLAHAIRRLDIPREWVIRAVVGTLWLAFAISATQYLLLGENRPGGINLAPIGYGFVVAAWSITALSFVVAGSLQRFWGAGAIAAGFAAVLITESKIDLLAFIAGAAVIAMAWASTNGRWRQMLGIGALVAVPLAFATYFMMSERFSSLWDELVMFRLNGSTEGGSFGLRYELNISGVRAFLESPFVGHGFAERMSQVFAHGTPGGPDVSFLSYVHNDYVTHMVAYGSMGLVFLVAYFVLTARLLLRVPDQALRHSGLALLAMLAVYMNADVGFNMDPLTSLVTLLLGIVLATPRPR